MEPNLTAMLSSMAREIVINSAYCQTSNIRHNLVGNEIVNHSDVVVASSVGTAPTTSSFST